MTSIPNSPLSSATSPAQDAQPHDGEMSFWDRFGNLLAVVIPFAGVITAIILVWGWGFTWVELCLMVGMYLLTVLGISVGYHRLFTHRGFETHPVIKYILAVMGSMAVQGPLLRWVAQHRRHHQFSDTPGDPHSPHAYGRGFVGMVKGIWHAHLGWIFDHNPPGMARYVKDLSSDRALRWVSKMFPLWMVLGLLIPTLLGGLIMLSWEGALLGFIWGGLVRIFLVHHVTWSVNSVCHIWGKRPFNSHDESRNNAVFGVLALGEGWHNNHHAFPNSARHGLRWYQFDFSYWVIRALALVGLAWKVKLPTAEAIAEKLRRSQAARQ